MKLMELNDRNFFVIVTHVEYGEQPTISGQLGPFRTLDQAHKGSVEFFTQNIIKWTENYDEGNDDTDEEYYIEQLQEQQWIPDKNRNLFYLIAELSVTFIARQGSYPSLDDITINRLN